jgi:tetratricopeptide (TPR) repeat protein
LLKGSLLYDLGKWDDSIKAYRGYPPAGPLAFLAKEGQGYAEEAKALAQTDAAAKNAGLADALKTFAAIQPDEKGAHYDLAAYHQARVLAEQGDSAKAIELYKKALAKNPPIEFATQIKTRLALLGDTSQQAQ